MPENKGLYPHSGTQVNINHHSFYICPHSLGLQGVNRLQGLKLDNSRQRPLVDL